MVTDAGLTAMWSSDPGELIDHLGGAAEGRHSDRQLLDLPALIDEEIELSGQVRAPLKVVFTCRVAGSYTLALMLEVCMARGILAGVVHGDVDGLVRCDIGGDALQDRAPLFRR